MIDERSLFPPELRGPEATSTRHALYALAAGRRGAEFGDLTAEQQDSVMRWAVRIGDYPTLGVRVTQDGTLTLWDLSEPVAERAHGVDPVRL